MGYYIIWLTIIDTLLILIDSSDKNNKESKYWFKQIIIDICF